MDKPLPLYEVSKPDGTPRHIYAATGDQAKRIYCKEKGIRPGEHWCGVRSLTARKMRPEEAKAWEDQAEERRGTFALLKGLMDICAKACAEGVKTS